MRISILSILCTMLLVACTPHHNKSSPNLLLKDIIATVEKSPKLKFIEKLQLDSSKQFHVWSGYDYTIDSVSRMDTLHFKSTQEVINKGLVNVLWCSHFISNDSAAYVNLYQLKTHVSIEIYASKQNGSIQIKLLKGTYLEDSFTYYDQLIIEAVQQRIKRNKLEEFLKNRFRASSRDSLWLYKGSKPVYLWDLRNE